MIPLINIVFLILIFFLVASTVRPFSDREVRLAQSSETKGAGSGTRMIVVRSDGTRYVAGAEVSQSELNAYLAEWAGEADRGITVVADKDMPATDLIDVVTAANAAGLQDVKLLTRKAR